MKLSVNVICPNTAQVSKNIVQMTFSNATPKSVKMVELIAMKDPANRTTINVEFFGGLQEFPR